MATPFFVEEGTDSSRLAFSISLLSRRAVCNFFDKKFPPDHLPSILNKNHTTLSDLKSSGKLTKSQWDLLFPTKGAANSETFDVNLMICLIINLTSITPPTNGFNNLPLKEETTPGADLARIKWFIKGHFLHDRFLTYTEFIHTVCKDISPAVIRLGDEMTKLKWEALLQSSSPSSSVDELIGILSRKTLSKPDNRTLLVTYAPAPAYEQFVYIDAEQLQLAIRRGSGSQSFITSPEDNKAITEFTYSYNAFTRCNFFRKRYGTRPYDSDFLKVRVLHKQGYTVNRTEFAVETYTEPFEKNDYGYLPTVNVCILQSGKDISLTVTDKDILKKYMEYYSQEAVVFMIDEDITDLQWCAVSKQIEGELEVNEQFNDILHRLFPRKTDGIASGIAIRLSMLFEKQLIDRFMSLTAMPDLISVKKHNELDLQYHQLKCVSLRNELICEFGYEGNEKGKLFVSIEKPEHEIDVKDYLQTFLPNASDIEIVEFTEIEIANMALKSGDQVKQNGSLGTVGLYLTAGTRHFGATCKHVIDDVDPDNSNVIITNIKGENFKTDNVYKPSDNLDFVAIRLSDRLIHITSGLKNQFARFVDGCIFGNDMMIPHGQHVYKWGATSTLTNGNFSRIKERKNLPATVEIKCVESTAFSSPGDSGSLICYSEAGFEYAAFILFGCARNDATLSFGYKLVDAMNACKTFIHPNIKACIKTDNELFFNN